MIEKKVQASLHDVQSIKVTAEIARTIRVSLSIAHEGLISRNRLIGRPSTLRR